LETQRPRRKLGENNHRTFTVMPLLVCKYGCSAGPIREARQVSKKQKTRNRKQKTGQSRENEPDSGWEEVNGDKRELGNLALET
jgi:hypothetical protein